MRQLRQILLLICLLGLIQCNPLSRLMNRLFGGENDTILASCFTDSTGMRDNDLYDGYNYAELSNDYTAKDFNALGGLSYGYQLRITYNGNSIIATKGDVGAGGPNHPKIDLHTVAAQALGIDDCDGFLDYVQIEYLG